MGRLFPKIFFVISIALIACKEESSKIDKVVSIEKFADFACKASLLKNERFTLADSIRFYEDSVLHPNEINSEKIDIWKILLQRMGKRKLFLIDESRIVADSMRSVLYELTKDMSLTEKREFSLKLESLKIQRGCN